MAGATTVGATQVALTPDLTQFGAALRAELPLAIRDPAKAAGDLAGDLIGRQIREKLTAPINVTIRAALEDKAAAAGLDKISAGRTVQLTADLDDKAAGASLARLTADRTVTVRVALDERAAKSTLDTLFGKPITVDILPEIQAAAHRTATQALKTLTADRTAKIIVGLDDTAARTRMNALAADRTTKLKVDLNDTAALARLKTLTRPRATEVVAVVATAQAEADLSSITTPLHVAVTPALQLPGASEIADYVSQLQGGINRAMSGVSVGASTGRDNDIAARLATYTAAFSRPIQVPIEPRVSLVRSLLVDRWRARVGEPITIAITPDISQAASLTAAAALADLTRPLDVPVHVEWSASAAAIVRAHLHALQDPLQVPIQPVFDSSATPVVAAHLQRLRETIEVIIKPIWDSAAALVVAAHIDAFREPIDVLVRPVWDSTAAAAVRARLRALADPVTAGIRATVMGAPFAAAGLLLDWLARRRQADIDVRVNRSALRNLDALGSSGERGSGGLKSLISSTRLLAVGALGSLPTLVSLANVIWQMGPAAALAAPAMALLGTSMAAIKIGTSGVGDALKAAFASTPADANAAASATNQVESAQRQLAASQRGVADAERSLTQAQRDARIAQGELSAARRQAARDIEDMNARLRAGHLDQEQAALDLLQAEADLQAARSDPAATQLQIQQSDLATQRARANVDEQSRQQKRLQADTAAVNKAGIDGSDQVVQAREKIRDANARVADQSRALADAHRQVADAARQVAQSHQSAATQASKFSLAMAKLSPNARAFVNEIRALAPAWRGLKLDVQDKLFAGLGSRLGQVARQVMPTLRSGIGDAATELNSMGKYALTAVANLQKTGQLRGVFDVVRSGLGNLRKIPGQVVTGLGQLTVAAKPAFERVTKGAGSAMDTVMAKLAKGMESGKLTDSINHALDVMVSMGHVIADLFASIGNIMKAAGAAGGDFFAVIGGALKEIRRVTAMPEVQAALKAIFQALNAIAGLIATTLGAVVKAVLPVLAALAPTIVLLAKLLGPVLATLAETLGKALMPIAKALGPVVVMVGKALIQVVKALMPLLKPIGQLITGVIKALAPVLGTVVSVIVQIVKALAGPLLAVIKSLLPLISLFGKIFAQVFVALRPAITPLIGIVASLVGAFAGVIKTLVPALMPLVPVIMTIVKIFTQLLLMILKPLIPIMPMIARLIGTVLVLAMQTLTPILKMVADIFKQLLPELMPLMPLFAQLVMAVLQLVTVALKPLMAIIGFVAKLLVGVLGAALKHLVPIVVKVLGWVVQLATIVTKVVTKIVKGFQWLFDVLLGHSIIPDIVRGAVGWFTSLWHKGVKIFNSIREGIVETWTKIWSRIKSVASSAWGLVRKGFDRFADGLKGAFRVLKDGLGKIWDGLKAVVKAPVKFFIETVYMGGLRKAWKATAGKLGIPNLPAVSLPKGFARGGVLPGWSPGRDIHRFYSKSGGALDLSGGESVMRPEFTRALGAGRVHGLNRLAATGGAPAVRRALGVPGYSDGGILGSLWGGAKNMASDVASGVGNVIDKGVGLARGGIAALAEAAFKPIRAIITSDAPGGKNEGSWGDMVQRVPLYLMDQMIDFIRDKDDTASTGAWAKPVNVPYGTRFGVKGPMWSSGHHTGLDFPASTGTRIGAVASGTVASATSGGPYGNHLTLTHGGGLSSLYAHMSAIAAKVGASLGQGDRIGSVGATGNVTGPHLHLEARLKGRTVDPMPYLKGGADPGGGTGVSRWHGVVVNALREVGQSVSLVNTTLRRMNQESGGNPKAVNRSDVNWQAGHPSVGLMQVIGPTFDAYAGKYRKRGPKMYGVSIDPMANLYSSMRYALGSYGSLSRAYNRPGGYAAGGTARPGELAWVGERGAELMRVIDGGVRIYPHEQSKRMARTMGTAVPGFASGGIIRTPKKNVVTVGGKKIDEGPIAASIGAAFVKGLTGTVGAIKAAVAKVTTAIKTAFKGADTTVDDKLLTSLSKQSKALQKLAAERDKIRAKIKAADTLAAESTGAAKSFAALTSLPNGGNTFDAGGILAGMNVRLGQLKAFSANLRILAKRGLDKGLLQQLISAGPDGGAAYAQALVAATSSQLKAINAAQIAIGKTSSAYGKAASDAMYDAGKQSGKGYLAGLKATEKSIENAMSSLAKKIANAVRSALKIKSPSRVFHDIGLNTGLGLEGGLRASTPQVAAAASQMAAIVRASGSAAAGTRMDHRTYNGGERNLTMNVTTTDQPTEQAVMRGWDHHDLLHRPVLIGG
ncbi:peptidoglycan DD-metalloendopeptidase family protein [Streptomyces sp. H27-D2]|uniref:peptidoglycan DD-metalloendopeptidase family protein n=1 Tax=Streptomyces sp. H27-D2 TaxID=3046304 RepID=UPI002DB970DA|nr:peptidoglycan DD-metalloendopeptidase family protein [Streptomyces sp. H27-D2]MEC4016102.1 peptidoglycan DD-metalloendopeptidase family protein [Streptomyces sp. H27-D2]